MSSNFALFFEKKKKKIKESRDFTRNSFKWLGPVEYKKVWQTVCWWLSLRFLCTSTAGHTSPSHHACGRRRSEPRPLPRPPLLLRDRGALWGWTRSPHLLQQQQRAHSLSGEHRCAKPLEYPHTGEAGTNRRGGQLPFSREKGKSPVEGMAVEEEGLRVFQSVKIKIGKKDKSLLFYPPPYSPSRAPPRTAPYLRRAVRAKRGTDLCCSAPPPPHASPPNAQPAKL